MIIGVELITYNDTERDEMIARDTSDILRGFKRDVMREGVGRDNWRNVRLGWLNERLWEMN